MRSRVVACSVAALVASFVCGCGPNTPASQVPEAEIPAPGDAPLRVPDDHSTVVATKVVSGLEGLYIGMPVRELVERLGTPVSVATPDDERNDWEKAGYATNRSVIFAIGFDRVLTFERRTVPLFKAYVAEDRVRALKFVYYGSEEQLKKRPVGFESCLLGGAASSVEQVFGAPEVAQHEEAMSTLDKAHYFDRGISVTVEEGKVVVFDIYAPPGAKIKEQLVELIRSERRRL